MSSNNVEKIKESLSIVDVISQYLKLEKAGSNFRAKCPFHNEKTPSFFVSPVRNSFYCFGCNAKGDIFSFVERFEGLDFMGALKVLAEKAGVEIVFEKKKETDKKIKLYDILERANLFFENNLKEEKEVLKYLENRGLNKKTINNWRIGYSANSWSDLHDYLKKTYSSEEIEKAGLIKKKEIGSEYYDRFRGRIMFPIFDSSGRIIAFSGRIFKEDDKSAKYINSPETELFSKSKILYGYNRAKFSIRKLNFSIVVEGQIDLLASHQAGFTNAVALSGTALTQEQIGLLNRMSNNIVLAFDSDKAGIASSGKSAIMALVLGMDVKVAYLEQGEDPADVLKKDKEKWKKAIREAKHIIDFYLEVFSKSIKDKRKLRLKISQIVLPYVAIIPNKIDQAHFVSTIAHRIGVSEDAVYSELNKANIDSNFYKRKKDIDIEHIPKRLDKKASILRKLMGIIIWQRMQKKVFVDIKNIIKESEDILGKEKFLDINKNQDNTEELLFETEYLYINNEEKLKDEADELLNNLRQECLKEDMEEILSKLKLAEEEENSKKINKFMKEYKKLSDKLSKLILCNKYI